MMAENDLLVSRNFIKNNKIVESSINKDYTFCIASYNILADAHMRALGPDVYDLSSPELDQSFRHERLMKELEYLSTDVVCLQECGVDYYAASLEPAMKGLGYRGVFKKRLGDIHPEGEATFYRTSRFTNVHSSSIALKDLSDQALKDSDLDEETKRGLKEYLKCDEVLLVTKLRCNFTQKEVTIGNTHIKFTFYKRLGLQCVEVACAVKELVNVAGGPDNAYVLCGDFNALANMAPYQLARDGYLNDDSIQKLQVESLAVRWPGFKEKRPNLRSAYLEVKGVEPDATTADVTGVIPNECVDYIFSSPQALHILGVLDPPPESLLHQDLPLPNKIFPSDHVSMFAKLAFQ